MVGWFTILGRSPNENPFVSEFLGKVPNKVHHQQTVFLMYDRLKLLQRTLFKLPLAQLLERGRKDKKLISKLSAEWSYLLSKITMEYWHGIFHERMWSDMSDRNSSCILDVQCVFHLPSPPFVKKVFFCKKNWLRCHLGKRIALQLIADSWQIIEYMGGEHLCLHSISQNDEVSFFGQVGIV